MPTIPASIRRRLYPVCVAIAALAVGYGLLTEEQAALWLAVAAGLIGTTTATAYRPEADG